MKTRTLLLLSAVTGLAILLAGVALLFQLLGQDDVAPPSTLGDRVVVGDMVVVVESASEADGTLVVTTTLGGVDDADGAAGFRLIASGREARLVESCEATTVVPAECRLRFDVSSADGRSRQLFYERGDESARWELGAP
jgi:hypothetical protein